MQYNHQTEKSFGKNDFNFMQKFILLLVRFRICRGKMREFVQKLWDKHSIENSTFDIEYHGVRLRLKPSSNNIERKILLSSKFREKIEIDAIASMPADGVFVDIGANIGYYSLMLAHRLPNAKIIACEPNPELYERFCDNIALNHFKDSIKVMQTAIGDKVKIGTLAFFSNSYGTGSINPKMQVSNMQKSIEVKITPLKDLLENIGVQKIHALKIDIEGYEDKALLPYFRIVDKNYWPNIIVIEDNNIGQWEENVIAFMLENGYNRAIKTRGNAVFIR